MIHFVWVRNKKKKKEKFRSPDMIFIYPQSGSN